MNNDVIEVLLVDDHRAYRSAAAGWLSMHPNLDIVSEADSVEAALAKLASTRVDLVVLDVHMKDIDGIDGAGLIFDRYPDVHILLCSTSDRNDLPGLARFAANQNLTFISKPDLEPDAIVQWFRGRQVTLNVAHN